MNISWWQWFPWRPWRVVATVDAADDVPATLPPRGAVLVGSTAYPKWLAFDCPCRTNHRVMISLDPRNRPCWRATVGKRLTVSPSIDALQGRRRCHYFIRNGRTVWARSEEN